MLQGSNWSLLIWWNKIVFRLRFPQKYSNLVHDLNENAYDAGLGPIAEVYEHHYDQDQEYGKDYADDAGFDLENAKSFQEINSMQEIKNMEEISNIQEIKSMQEVPDDIAEEFIKVACSLLTK